MRLVASPDSVVDRFDRALWLTPPFDLAFLLSAPGTWHLAASQVYVSGATEADAYVPGSTKAEINIAGAIATDVKPE